MLLNILFKIISFTKNLFFIKRLVALAILIFAIYEFSGDVLFASKARVLEPIKAENLLQTTDLDKYILLSDYKIDNNYPFAVKKVFKKDKISHFYLPLVSKNNPKKIIALINDNSTKDSSVLKTNLYNSKINLSQNYFKKDIASKLLNGEREFYEANGFSFSDSFLQLEIDTPPTSSTNYLIFICIASIIVLIILLSFIPRSLLNKWFNQYTGIDYSFGNKAIKKIVKLVIQKKYDTALNRLSLLSTDEQTQAIDALALMLNDKHINQWNTIDGRSPLFQVVKGNRLLYDAWEARGYAYADETSMESALGFHELLNQANTTLNQVQEPLKVEANNLLIRANKGLSEKTAAKNAFLYCISAKPEHTMAYLGYLDVILPKWLGDEDEVNTFIKEYENKSLFIESILKAKWLIEQVNYNEQNKDYTEQITAYFNRYEPQIKALKTNSPHKYVLYNYLYFLADEINNKKLARRYEKKVKDYLSPTIYTPLRSAKEIKEKLG